MRIAILIGISEYKSQEDLKACYRDAEAIKELLISTGNYAETDILQIKGFEKASIAKEKIILFLKNYEDQNIQEVFFYYSGHGLYNEDEFYYIMSDYDVVRLRLTSIENSEIDNLLRNLKPELTIKVIDACNSGLSYLKSGRSLKEVLDKTKSIFKSCYFLLSSQVDQASMASSDSLSYFTESFLVGITNCPHGTVRYKHIIDAISDYFEQFGKQTPQFVMQGTLRETFCKLDDKLEELIENILNKYKTNPNKLTQINQEAPITPVTSLKELIELDAKNYIEKNEVDILISNIKSRINEYHFPQALSQYYDFVIEFIGLDVFSDDNPLPSPEVIGRWLNSEGKSYFGQAIWEQIEEPATSYYSVLNPLYNRSRREITDFKLTSYIDFNMIKIRAKSKYPNIQDYEFTIIIILSKLNIGIFYYMTKLININWDDHDLPKKIQWHSEEYLLKQEGIIINSITSILKKFADGIQTQLEKQFLPVDE